MANSYRNRILEQLDEIENELSVIIQHCEQGDYSMSEIAEELQELSNKLYQEKLIDVKQVYGLIEKNNR